MAERSPKTLAQFQRWLEVTIDDLAQLCEYGDPDVYDELEIAQVVNEACTLACRFGLGKASEPEHALLNPSDGLAILGDVQTRVLDRVIQPADLISDKQVGRILGMSRRTVWRRNSAGEIPAPVKEGGRTVWRRTEIEAMIEEMKPAKR